MPERTTGAANLAPRDAILDQLRSELMYARAHADIYGGQDRWDACNRARAAYDTRLAELRVAEVSDA